MHRRVPPLAGNTSPPPHVLASLSWWWFDKLLMMMMMMTWVWRLLVLCWWHGDYCCRHDEGNSICNNQVADRLTSGKIEKPPFLDWFAMCLETISCRNPVYLLIATAGTGCAWYNQLLNVCRRQANIRSAAIFQRPTAISRAPLPSGQKNYVHNDNVNYTYLIRYIEVKITSWLWCILQFWLASTTYRN